MKLVLISLTPTPQVGSHKTQPPPQKKKKRKIHATKGAMKYVSTPAEAREHLSKYDCVVFDCDGVVWVHNAPLPGAAAALDVLHARGRSVFFVTNMSAKTRVGLAEKFHRLGLRGGYADERKMVTSASAAADLLATEGYAAPGKKVYVVGEVGLAAELEGRGIRTVGVTGGRQVDGVRPPVEHEGFLKDFVFDPEVKAVVAGLDFHVNYWKIAAAAMYVQQGAEFFATNEDKQSPVPGGAKGMLPGSGSLVIGPIATVSKTRPRVIAKPSPVILEQIIAGNGFDKRRVLMVGDRLDTDIQFGVAAGVDTMLVESGIATAADAAAAEAEQRPTYVAPSIAVFAHLSDAAKL